MKSVWLEMSSVRTDGGTQMRETLSTDVFLDYRDRMLAGDSFPPIDVFYDGTAYWLADGFHRFYGAREAKLKTIAATVHNGTVRDAILFAVGANVKHGLKRTNADKRRAVEAILNDEAWVLWSDHRIAEVAGVGNSFVSNLRAELSTVDSSPAAKTADEPKVGLDGKARKPKPKQPKREPPKLVAIDDPPEEEAKPPAKSCEREPLQRMIENKADKFVVLRWLFDSCDLGQRTAAMALWSDWMDSQ
jgi:hypothetical protein